MRSARHSMHNGAVRMPGYAGRYSAAGAGVSTAAGDARSLLAILAGDDSLTAHLAWQDDALCAQVGSDLFYPEKGGSVALPRSVCAACPVRRECLTDALGHMADRGPGQHGVWGGTSPQEREALLDQFGGDVAAAADFALREQPAADPAQQPRKAA